jgi:riboflavin biosynthesis pyrimidine reductase
MPSSLAGDLRNDGGSVAAAGADGSEARLDGTLRPEDRRGKEVRRVEHLGPGRLERGARAWGLGKAVQQLKEESGKGLFVGGVKLPLALAELGLIDEYEFVVHPRLVGHGPTLFAGLSKRLDLKLVSRLEFGSGAVAMRYEPRR